MNEKVVANGIAAFIEKYLSCSKMLESPQWNFRINGVSNVDIAETSLKEYEERWTFKGTADIEKKVRKAQSKQVAAAKLWALQ